MLSSDSLTRDHLLLGGEWRTADDTVPLISPHSGQPIGTAPSASPADMDAAVAAARHAFDRGPWPRMSRAERVGHLEHLAAAYERRVDEMANTITAEMGAPITAARTRQAAAAVQILRATIAAGNTVDWESRITTARGDDALIRRLPVGVVGAITPFNFPQMLMMAKLAPALLTGCTVVVKPALECSPDALLLAELIVECDFPAGVVSVVPAGAGVSEQLVRHPLVDKIGFTGSTAVGRRIATLCAQDMRRYTLELGGKSAAIVLDDADPAHTAAGLRNAAMANSGQGCVSQTRILVPRSRHDEFVEAIVEMVRSMPIGDPRDEAVEVGPLATEKQLHRVSDYIRLGMTEGATVALGGPGRPHDLPNGWYVNPTVFVDVDNRMRVAREEIFGPVLCVIDYDGDDEAIAIAEDSDYGLGGSVWTQDRERGRAVADRVRVGTVGVNTFGVDVTCPFGGFKASGVGREFGAAGLLDYTELQTVYMQPATPSR